MEIVIKIPEEFEKHFNSDRFEDSLQRVRFDIHKSIIGKKNVLSGNYEIETLDMLTEAFLNGTSLPKGHGRLGDLDALREEVSSWGMNDYEPSDFIDVIDQTETIIEAKSEDKG